MKQRFKVLWLPAWYPCKVDFLNGDFVERHATAVSKYVDVVVLFAIKDPTIINTATKIECKNKEGLYVYMGYYNSSIKSKVFRKLTLAFLYFKLLFQLYKIAYKQHGHFSLIHVHISLKQGLFALWLKLTKRMNYVITEHNSWFMPFGNTNFTKNHFLKLIIRANFKYASAVHVVSQNLGNELQKKYTFIKTFSIIPNVVDSNLFFYIKHLNENLKINFFAVNGNNLYQKNTDGIIRAFSDLIRKRNDCVLHIAGPNDKELKERSKELNLEEYVKFYGTIPSNAVAKLMQDADAFIFFTRYETFGCVMVEALCCGKPIIASNIDVLKENLEENSNSIFVESENEYDLTEKLIYFVNNRDKFDNKEIAEEATKKYNFDKIGKDFLSFYKINLKE
jgi:glycosyltransferase involved in cell wall biosynthesis